MHRMSMRNLSVWIVSTLACIALVGGSWLSAQNPRPARTGGPLTHAEAAAKAKASAPAAAAKPAAAAAHAKAPATAHPQQPRAATVNVSGTVTDGSGQGWPLYARIEITSDSTEPVVVYTDPVTGTYSTDVFDGFEYAVAVTAVSQGYLPGAGPIVAAGDPIVADWPLEIEPLTCSAPGYGLPSTKLYETFPTDAVPDGWSIDNVSGAAHWEIKSGPDPCGFFPGNDTGGTGNYAIVNSNCFSDTENTDDTALVTPTLDLSSLANPVIQWDTEYIQCCGQIGDVDISTDGGTSWTNVWEATDENIVGPSTQSVDLTSLAGGEASVTARFHFQGLWAGWWQVDNVLLGGGACVTVPGGLVVGNVIDANAGTGLNGATVANLTHPSTVTTFATPEDTNQPDGFYILFSPAGPQNLEASKDKYASDSHPTTVFTGSVVRRDFVLQSGSLTASPRPASSILSKDGVGDLSLHLANSGAVSANFEIFELNIPPVESFTSGFVSDAVRKAQLDRLTREQRTKDRAPSAKGLPPFVNAPSHPKPKFAWSGGDVLASYDTNIPYAWGVGYDGANDTWLSNLWLASGENAAYQYLADGTMTGALIDLSPANPDWWTADGAYNANTGMMWFWNAQSGACIFELDPVHKVATGNTICPDLGGVYQRGLAFDPTTNTFYTGSWLDGVISHFDLNGTVLDSAFVGLSISGLTYFPKSGHLFVIVNDFDEPVTILDALNNYAFVNSFEVAGGVFGSGGGAGMEADCLGNLILVNQASQVVYKVASGEGPLCSIDIPWLTVSPTIGTVPGTGPGVGQIGSNPYPVDLTFNSTGLLPGLYQAQLLVGTDTPNPVPPVPVNLTVLFDDVPQGSFAWNYIYGAAGAGIMRGCSFFSFCPDLLVTRAAMAGYIERAIHGPFTSPPVYLGGFQDVFFNAFNANYIQGLVNDGITAGCSVNPPLYCPDAAIPREQMAVFILLAEHGSDYVPPDCMTPIFDDVPCDSNFAIWVNQLYTEGITAGCSTTPALFCPNHDPANTDPNNGWVTSAQMAVYLSVAFHLPHVP